MNRFITAAHIIMKCCIDLDISLDLSIMFTVVSKAPEVLSCTKLQVKSHATIKLYSCRVYLPIFVIASKNVNGLLNLRMHIYVYKT